MWLEWSRSGEVVVDEVGDSDYLELWRFLKGLWEEGSRGCNTFEKNPVAWSRAVAVQV